MGALRSILAVAVAAALAGCALKSPPERDELANEAAANRQVPEKWTAQGGAPDAVADGWLASFSDTQLDELVREALAYNPDLRVAAARVEQAAAYAKLADATLCPQVNVLARGGGEMSGDSSGLQGVGVFVDWELDLWGRVRSGAAAASPRVMNPPLATADTLANRWPHTSRKSTSSPPRPACRRRLADETVRGTTRLVGLAGQRERVGLGDAYDTTLARANVETTPRHGRNSSSSPREQSLRALEALRADIRRRTST